MEEESKEQHVLYSILVITLNAVKILDLYKKIDNTQHICWRI